MIYYRQYIIFFALYIHNLLLFLYSRIPGVSKKTLALQERAKKTHEKRYRGRDVYENFRRRFLETMTFS